MEKTKKAPNKKIRTILLGILLLVYLPTIVYVAITKDNNNLAGRKMDDIYLEEDYDYEEDEYYDEDEEEKELNIYSDDVQAIYSYVEEYPYVVGLKDNYKVSLLTQEEKMRLVAASLKSKDIIATQPVVDVTEIELNLNNRYYYASQPNVRYKSYEVLDMYEELFGTSDDFNYSTLMYDGSDIVYKYSESTNGYIKYIAADKKDTPTTSTAVLTKAIRRDKEMELHIKYLNKTEIYLFEETCSYDDYYTYKFIGKTTEQEKNSL